MPLVYGNRSTARLSNSLGVSQFYAVVIQQRVGDTKHFRARVFWGAREVGVRRVALVLFHCKPVLR